jgi:hypothetical protein
MSTAYGLHREAPLNCDAAALATLKHFDSLRCLT